MGVKKPAMFVIVRHGNTFAAGEPPRRIGARTDLPLTDQGRSQAEALGAHFAALGWCFARVLASPLLRTRATAQAIVGAQGGLPAPVICDWLAEIDHGPDEDKDEATVLARIGHDALAAWDAQALPPPGWRVDAERRIEAWRALFAAPPADGPVLLVTSNGAARFALLADPGLTVAMRGLPSLKLPTGGYGLLRREADGAWRIPVWGQRP